jgi:hypothetical protein
MRFSPSQVHAQQHFGPVLRLGATCARLNVEIGIVVIHFTGKHSPKFEARQLTLESLQILCDFIDGRTVVFLFGKRQQVGCLYKASGKRVEIGNDPLQLRAFLAERLGTRRIIPDVRLFQFPLDLGQSLGFVFIVKDTSSARQCAR